MVNQSGKRGKCSKKRVEKLRRNLWNLSLIYQKNKKNRENYGII